jgi:hypothetical protein
MPHSLMGFHGLTERQLILFTVYSAYKPPVCLPAVSTLIQRNLRLSGPFEVLIFSSSPLNSYLSWDITSLRSIDVSEQHIASIFGAGEHELSYKST